ncbi:hypothetical protein KLP40_12555 [Hymenobacter sp. NST-14]|uniref:hypothetical protein n=1 Tax=Hymenobacter piscis TaxID=2839984 RepID=UPI001C02F6A1|nr:hypothetical protein [Hymenobacter piscis]MBT9393995.1 hypothetical protein [Hymenobacter piscis]
MLHRLSFAPFPDTATAHWFAALGDALAADGAAGLLLANLDTEAEVLPAVVVLPGRVAILRPPSASAGTLPGQQAALARWLGTWPELPPVPAAAIAGFIVPLDSADAAAADAQGWAVVPPAQLAEELRAQGAEAGLTAPALHRWTGSLTEEDPAAETSYEHEPAGFWEQKARQLWGWLGAEDVPADPPYGTGPPPASGAAEQHRLEQLRRQMLDELQQQRRAMEAREAAREQSITQLRQQLAATPSAATEVAALQARLTAETREKNRLAAAIEAARAEAEVRNRELEARMQQLGQQVQQLQTPPAAPRPAAGVPAAGPATPAPAAARPVAAPTAAAPARPTGRPRVTAPAWRLQWTRVALVLLVLALIGVGAVAVQRYSRQWFEEVPLRQERPAADADVDNTDENLEAAAPTLFDIQPDTVQVDEPDSAAAAPEVTPEPAAPNPGEVMDSVVAPEEGI